MAMRDLLSDLRFSLRILRRNPGFSAAAAIVLALGIGANTAIFSVVNAVLLRPLPFDDPSRIMQVWHVPPAKSFPGLTMFSVSPANYLDWRSQSSSFEHMAAYGFRSFNVGGKERPEAIQAAAVAPASDVTVEVLVPSTCFLGSGAWHKRLYILRVLLAVAALPVSSLSVVRQPRAIVPSNPARAHVGRRTARAPIILCPMP